MIKILTLLSAFWASTALGEKRQFSDFFNPLESLSANFTQTTYSNTGALIQNTSGAFDFKRPQQLRWHTIQPNEQILLLNNNELWLIDIDLEQASLQKNQDLSKTPLHYLINKPGAITNMPKFAYSKEGIDWYIDNTQNLSFGFKGKLLQAVSLKNKLEQTVLIIFSQLKINPKIKPEIFKLKLNPDFDIIK